MKQDKYYFIFKKHYIKLKGIKAHFDNSLRGNGKEYTPLEVKHVIAGLHK